ncbi:MAG: hypothetical protein J6W06_10310 [Bacteroidales bacterium]|nr:hypothetical protein [Bacteroidales bacterium]
MKNRKLLQSELKKVDFETFVTIRKNWQKESNNVISESKGVSMDIFLQQSEKELQTRAKSLICSIMAKGKYRFSQNQAKFAVESMTRKELIKCVNNTHFNTDLLFSAVIRKMQKYNKLTGKPTTKMK